MRTIACLLVFQIAFSVGTWTLSVTGLRPEGALKEEIVDRLRGLTAMKLAVMPRDPDRLGTPYFFHPISSDHIEIRSAGPDRKLETDDDILFDPPDPDRMA